MDNNTTKKPKFSIRQFASKNRSNIAFWGFFIGVLGFGAFAGQKYLDWKLSDLEATNNSLKNNLEEFQDSINSLNKAVKNYRELIETSNFPNQHDSYDDGKNSKINTNSQKHKLPIVQISQENNNKHAFEQKIKELETKIAFFNTENNLLTEENDELKGKLSLYQQKLARARELERKRINEMNYTIQAQLSEQIAKILQDVENGMNNLGIAKPIVLQTTDTIVVREVIKEVDYEKNGDAFLKQANADYQTLLTQPNRVWFSKNRTKEAFILSTLNNYNTALEYYKLAKNQTKIASTEKRIQDFKKEFGLQ